jgi:predicted PolB exonuclease-like 3'-5' exonuclease
MTARIFLDIETIPAEPDDPAWLAYAAELEVKLRNAKPPANYKSADAIGKWQAEHEAGIPKAIEVARVDSGLEPALGRIAVLCYAVDDSPVQALRCDDPSDEADALARLGEVLAVHRGYQLVGHNAKGFDAPFLAVRAYRHDLGHVARMVWRPGAKPWEQPVVGYAGRPSEAVPTVRGHTGRSLPTLCRLLGIPTDANPIDGSEVAAAWHDGRRAEVVRHCVEDVEQVREVYRRITGHAI